MFACPACARGVVLMMSILRCLRWQLPPTPKGSWHGATTTLWDRFTATHPAGDETSSSRVTAEKESKCWALRGLPQPGPVRHRGVRTLSVLGCSCHSFGAGWSAFAADPYMAPGMGVCARWCGEDMSAQTTSSSTLLGLHCLAAQGRPLPPECLI